MGLLFKIKNALGLHPVQIRSRTMTTAPDMFPPEAQERIKEIVKTSKPTKFKIGDTVTYLLDDVDTRDPRRPSFSYAHVVDIDYNGCKQEFIGIRQGKAYIKINPIFLKKL